MFRHEITNTRILGFWWPDRPYFRGADNKVLKKENYQFILNILVNFTKSCEKILEKNGTKTKILKIMGQKTSYFEGNAYGDKKKLKKKIPTDLP